MKLYISGPITGYPNKNQEAFEETAAVVKQLGLHPVTPFDLDVIEPCHPKDWVANMKRDVKYIPSFDGYVLLDGWEESRGARLEVMLADAFALPLYKLDDNGQLQPVYVDVSLAVREVNLTDYVAIVNDRFIEKLTK